MSIPNLKTSTLFDVKGKNCLVTGGGTGLGQMMAAGLVANGANVIIASRKEKALRETADAFNKAGSGKCEFIVADVGSKAGCDALVAEVKKRVPNLHVLINNSGVTWGAPLDNFPEAQGWDRVVALNMKAIYYITAGLVDHLSKDATNLDPGRVINIASTAALNATAEETGLAAAGTGVWSYNASKAGAVHLGKGLAVSLAEKNITVNSVCPGVFPSRMTAYGLKEHGDILNSAQALGRVGSTEDLAGLTLFLSSRASAHISGAVIPIDGGTHLKARL